jgi:hypothetical protein
VLSPDLALAPPDDDSDVKITPAIRAYLDAFDDFLFAGSPRERQFARGAMADLCDVLLEKAGLPPRRAGALSAEDLRI